MKLTTLLLTLTFSVSVHASQTTCEKNYAQDATVDSGVSKTLEFINDAQDDYDYESINFVAGQVRQILRLAPREANSNFLDPLNMEVVELVREEISSKGFEQSFFCQGKAWNVQRLSGVIAEKIAQKIHGDQELAAILGVKSQDY
jgi:hypothetical protein